MIFWCVYTNVHAMNSYSYLWKIHFNTIVCDFETLLFLSLRLYAPRAPSNLSFSLQDRQVNVEMTWVQCFYFLLSFVAEIHFMNVHVRTAIKKTNIFAIAINRRGNVDDIFLMLMLNELVSFFYFLFVSPSLFLYLSTLLSISVYFIPLCYTESSIRSVHWLIFE